ncbi:nucleotidyltransferase family protein [Sulfurimonas sp. SAG-AH-194-C20]|nr:nucleotidyltransferase family protein [Sulfurimonas sp. SAG-AH-194-C20]MDF1879568.1 nucleotidyltransferase family protein [Sulfurimonas sp. SAG-AH-194-C20]
MTNIQNIKLSKNASIREALEIIDTGAVKFAIVVDEDGRLIGSITDGDIRRAILSGKSLKESISNVYSRDPVTVSINDSKEEIITLCTSKTIYQIPVVDENNRVVSIAILDELLKPEYHKNKVVLMVGGLGTRLRPLTDTTPKPMLPVGGKPILQTIVEKFVKYGFTNIIMCIGYKSHIIQDFFEDGSKFGANIEYILEDKRMGTAGALSLLNDVQKSKEPFFVMNGDLLTNVNFENLLEYHLQNDSMATMCVREYDFQVPYGVVKVNNGKITSIEEKPVHKFFVSAGIYMLSPKCIEMIPQDEFYDMPTLFEKLIDMNENTVSFPLREYWLDIGRMDEYEKANREYGEVF